MDKIVIRDLEVQAHIGVTEAERERPQQLLVTVEMSFDTSKAGRTDNMEATLDYAAIADLIEKTATSKPRNLIEAAAEDIAAAILKRKLAKAVTVEVKKFSIPTAKCVSVQITRPAEAG